MLRTSLTLFLYDNSIRFSEKYYKRPIQKSHKGNMLRTSLTLFLYDNSIRFSKKEISYKVKKEQVKTALNILDTHEQFTMSELLMIMKEKYKDFDISPQHWSLCFAELSLFIV